MTLSQRAIEVVKIADAWNSVTDRWIVRRNKMHDSRQWEVVHDWGREFISDDTMRVVGRFHTDDEAQTEADRLENLARASAVLEAALSAALAVDGLCLVQGWRPIETAPKDGTWVLVSAHNLHACDAQWSSDAYENVGWFDGSGFFSTQPTHWCPLPMIAAANDGEDRR